MQTFAQKNSNSDKETAFLVVDTESVPDGRLLNLIKYPEEMLTPEQAIAKAQAEAVEKSWNQSDFLPVTFQIPIAICVVKVADDFSLLTVSCLDAPQFRTREMVVKFWTGVNHYQSARLVTFNGRGFDLPLLELAAFRYGVSAPRYYSKGRNRFSGDLDLMDWMTNFGAYRFPGGLDLLAKLLGKPGKNGMSGNRVYEYYQAGRLQEINEYCLADALDTYFVFLRTRVLTGDLKPHEEAELIGRAKDSLAKLTPENPAMGQYLAAWRDTPPWP